MLSILKRKPLEYEVVRQRGSHRVLESPKGYGRVVFSAHDNATLPPGMVRKILVDQAGLDEEEARQLV